MTVLPIHLVPHPVLKTKAETVNSVDDKIKKLLDDMMETMYAARGIGLAAPQIGVSQRVIVLDVEQRVNKDDEDAEPEKGAPLFMVNPEIIWSSEEMNVYNEGCLSIPEQYADIERPKQVKVKYLDYHGKVQEIDADGLLSTCLQHEIDHINGILFIDYLSLLKRDMIVRKIKKWAKENPEAIGSTHIL